LAKKINKEVAALVIQYPNFFGSIENLQQFADMAHAVGALLIVCADPVSLGVLESPGKLGADIVVGEGQSLGLPLSFGGPYLGFMAAREKYMRRLPGRIVGKTVDRLGREGFVLTLQAREQHIRREKASSNICSNQALCALAATLYLSLLGPGGLEEVGKQCLQKSHYAKTLLTKIKGVTIPFQVPTFKEFVVKTEEAPESINQRLWEAGILGGLDLGRYYPELAHHILLCVTEVRTKEEIDKLAQVWGDNG
jgi:glycine dehydrogenase subunit 1